ncbi:MAG: HD domain-containing protein, partial [Pseudomonadota bacterium]
MDGDAARVGTGLAASKPDPAAGRFLRQFELVEKVKAYHPDADERLLNAAYVYAVAKHGEQKRASGDPYFSHPVSVAGLLAEQRLDENTIVAGLLHDTVEDTDANLDEIEDLFGPDVARLVDGVTKLSEIEYRTDASKQAENFQKLILATTSDIRVLLVKLADRLHNMRTL